MGKGLLPTGDSCLMSLHGRTALGSPIYFPANLLLFTLEALGLQQTALGFLGRRPFCPAFDLERVLSTQKATAAL